MEIFKKRKTSDAERVEIVLLCKQARLKVKEIHGKSKSVLVDNTMHLTNEPQLLNYITCMTMKMRNTVRETELCSLRSDNL